MKWLIKGNKRASAAICLLQAIIAVGILVSIANGQDPSGRPSSSSSSSKRKKAAKKDVPPEAITIDLTVLTKPGGCEVHINGPNGELRATSDADGRAQFTKLAQGQYKIDVNKAGFESGSRMFEAGSETPTIEVSLRADISGQLKQFDSLVAAGKLIGPDTPNAFDLLDDLGKNFPDRTEVPPLKSTLYQRLMQGPEQQAKQIIVWREINRDIITTNQMLAAKAEALRPDEKRPQALDLFYQGAGALRDWQASRESGDSGADSNGAVDAHLADAKDKLQKAVQLQDNLTAAQYELGVVSLLSNDPSAAEAAFAKTTQLEPALAVARVNLGDAEFAEGKRKDAIEQYRKAIALDSANVAAHAGLGLGLAMTGQTKDGLKELDRAMSLNQNAALPHLDLGLVLADSKKKKDRERAQDEIKKAIELNPKNLEFQNSAARHSLAAIAQDNRK
ncbi:MAG TPA: tetratricopeptide repeat protein [Blastocatellia bacterium]